MHTSHKSYISETSKTLKAHIYEDRRDFCRDDPLNSLVIDTNKTGYNFVVKNATLIKERTCFITKKIFGRNIK